MDDKRKSVAITAGTGISLAAAAAALVTAGVRGNPWGSVVLDRVYDDFSFEPRPIFHRRQRSSGSNKKWSAAAEKRSAKRKAQKRARAVSRKHRKHG